MHYLSDGTTAAVNRHVPPCTDNAHVNNLHGHRPPPAPPAALRPRGTAAGQSGHERRPWKLLQPRETGLRGNVRFLHVRLPERAGPRNRRGHEGIGASGQEAQDDASCYSHGGCMIALSLSACAASTQQSHNNVLKLKFLHSPLGGRVSI